MKVEPYRRDCAAPCRQTKKKTKAQRHLPALPAETTQTDQVSCFCSVNSVLDKLKYNGPRRGVLSFIYSISSLMQRRNTMPYADHQGVWIHYQVEGEGPPLALQHGFSGSLEDWQEFGYTDRLKQDYQLILVDARGHG